MRIVLEETYAPEAAPRLAGHELAYFPGATVTREQALALLAPADVLVFRWALPFPIDAEFLGHCPNLKHIHKSGAGLEHAQVLDLEALARLGILFSNNVGINADAVAEHALMLTLLAMRPDTPRQIALMRQGIWDQACPQGTPRAMMLGGKTVGIVGVGQIGTNLAIRLRAMGVGRLLGHQRSPRFEHSLYAGIEWVGLRELMAACDVVVLCLPITPETRGLVGRDEIALLRPDAVLVNVGRGATLDEQALHEALSQGRLRGAALDVFAQEPSDSPLLRLPNVIATPHMGGTAVEVQQRQLACSIDAVEDFLLRRRPRRLANPEVLSCPALRAGWLAPQARAA